MNKAIAMDRLKELIANHPAPSCQECENLKHDLEGYMDANKELINREWQGLSDAEMVSIWLQKYDEKDIRLVCRAIEQALKEKNGYYSKQNNLNVKDEKHNETT